MSAKQFEKSEEWTDDNFSDSGEFQDDHVSCFLQDAISTLPLIFFSRHIISYLLFSVFSIFSVLFFYFSILSSFFSISFLLFFPPLFSTKFPLHPALHLFSLFFSNVLLFLLFLIVLFSFILPYSFLLSVFLLSLSFCPSSCFSPFLSSFHVWFSSHSTSSFLFLSSYLLVKCMTDTVCHEYQN